jgi:hypothetical protein
MSYKSSFAKMVYGSAICGITSSLIVYRCDIVEPSLWKDIFITFVTFGVTLAGFLLTALSIFAAFSATPYMKRLLQAEKTFGNIRESFLAAIVINLSLAVVSVVGVALVPKTIHDITAPPPQWTQLFNMATFVGGIYCTAVCMYYLRLILKALMKGERSSA